MLLSWLRRIPWGLQSQIPVKIPYSSPPILSSLPMPMDSSITFQRLSALAGHLRLYRPPPPSVVGCGEDEVSKEMEDRSGKVVSQVGFPESSTSIGQSIKHVEGSELVTKKAAVLVCLFEGLDGHLRVILTKRSSNLSTHSGEVALPGGKMDEGDQDVVDTATREAKEEIGLDPALVNVVTILDPFLSKNILIRVFPVIGFLSDKEAFKPFPNADEVEAIFDAPLEMFLRDENRRVEEREWMGCKYLVHFFDYETPSGKYLIWGLTSGILIRAASLFFFFLPGAYGGVEPLLASPLILRRMQATPTPCALLTQGDTITLGGMATHGSRTGDQRVLPKAFCQLDHHEVVLELLHLFTKDNHHFWWTILRRMSIRDASNPST